MPQVLKQLEQKNWDRSQINWCGDMRLSMLVRKENKCTLNNAKNIKRVRRKGSGRSGITDR